MARSLPNKEGGYAPNYTPTTAVDTHRDYIVDAEVLEDANENTEVVPMVERVEEAFGQRPEAVLAPRQASSLFKLAQTGNAGKERVCHGRSAVPRAARRIGWPSLCGVNHSGESELSGSAVNVG